MSQLGLNLVRNPTFQDWTGGVPDFFSSLLTNTTLFQLLRTDPRDHPRRVAFTTDKYVFDGSSALRAVIVTAGAVDEFRIWPDISVAGQQFNISFVGPFEILLGVNDTLRITETTGTGDAVMTAGFYDAVTLQAELETQLEAVTAGVNTYAIILNPNTRLWTLTRATGAEIISLLWAHANSDIGTLLGSDGVDDTGATTYTNPNVSPPEVPCIRVEPGQRYYLKTAARNTVDGNLLRVRLAVLDANFAVLNWLSGQDGVLAAGASSIDFPLFANHWTEIAVNVQIPMAGRYVMWQLSNGSAAAQTMDIGEVSFFEATSTFIAQEGRA